MTCGQHIIRTITSYIIHAVIRIDGERSKAPDSRLITFPAHSGSWRSDLLMEAWVRIALLTMSPFMTTFFSVNFYGVGSPNCCSSYQGFQLPRARGNEGLSYRGFDLLRVRLLPTVRITQSSLRGFKLLMVRRLAGVRATECLSYQGFELPSVLI